MKIFSYITLVSVLLFSGCVNNTSHARKDISGNDFINQNQKAVDALNEQLSRKITQEHPLIIATIVKMDHLSETSSFGRLVSEHISTRFTQLRYNVIETKLRDNLLIKQDEGEFLLSRELKDIAKSVSSQAVIVGTYLENSNDIYVNLKVVQPHSNLVLAATSYAIPKSSNVRNMLIK